MRFSAGPAANAAGWAVLAALILGAIVAVNRLGFLGLFLFGGLTLLVCTMATLDNNVSTWGENAFRAAMEQPKGEEARAAAAAERHATISPFKFYGRCGAFLAAVGAIGFIWQVWGSH